MSKDWTWEGKRVLVIWKDCVDADWISFRVVKQVDDGLFLQGVTSPEGAKHDGSHVFARHDEIRDIMEWKEKLP